MSFEFDLPKDQGSIIKVIGVGGGGGNAVNHMYRQGIIGVNFVVSNTDQQALDISPVPNKIQLGKILTEGRGAGMSPDLGKRCVMESIDQIKSLLETNTKMVFITAGMGKGTGTGGAPVIAKLARELGILTVGLVTTPFSAEGPKRFQQAQDGINELRTYVDALLVISNDKLREIHGNLAITQAFAKADDILAIAAKSIAEIITKPGQVNVDFNDVQTVMKDSGVAIMGMSESEGEQRAMNAVEAALNSPLLNDNDIRGAKNILINITSGVSEATLDELSDITEYVQREAGYDTNVIWGCNTDETLGEKISVTIIATGFESSHGRRTQYEARGRAANDGIREIKPRRKAKVVEQKENQVTFEFDGLENTAPSIQNNPAPVNEISISDLSEPVSMEEMQQAPFDEAPLESIEMSKDDYVISEKPEIDLVNIEEVPMINRPLANLDLKPELNKQAEQDRKNKLKNLSMPLNNPNVMAHLENTPAYLRRNVQLNDVQHSSDSQMGGYYLSNGDDNEGQPELKKNNTFLHGNDRVD